MVSAGVLKSAKDNSVTTRTPEAGEVLGVLLPAVFPETVSLSFFVTTTARIADSNERIPVTAVIGPAGISLVPGRWTVSMLLLAAGSPPGVVTTGPTVIGELYFIRYPTLIFVKST